MYTIHVAQQKVLRQGVMPNQPSPEIRATPATPATHGIQFTARAAGTFRAEACAYYLPLLFNKAILV
jgi:hypothetical protein